MKILTFKGVDPESAYARTEQYPLSKFISTLKKEQIVLLTTQIAGDIIYYTLIWEEEIK